MVNKTWLHPIWVLEKWGNQRCNATLKVRRYEALCFEFTAMQSDAPYLHCRTLPLRLAAEPCKLSGDSSCSHDPIRLLFKSACPPKAGHPPTRRPRAQTIALRGIAPFPLEAQRRELC
eukprot:EG_transcript_11210